MTTTKLLASAKYRLCTWEDNGYHDSDFYAAYYDETTGKLGRKLTDTTRFAGRSEGWIDPMPLLRPTVEIVEKAVAALEEHIFAVIRAAEHRDTFEPENAARGVELRLIRDAKHKGETFAAGLSGRVFWVGAHGKFYRNGYNQPCRSNRRVGLEFADGRKGFFALSACRLNREPMSDAELRQRARKLAQDCSFGAACGMKAWESTNEARAIWHAHLKEQAGIPAEHHVGHALEKLGYYDAA